jgi:hypothetical protein
MNTDREEEQIQEWFDTLQKEDKARNPSFESVMERPRSWTVRSASWGRLAAAAILAFLLIGGSYFLYNRIDSIQHPASITEWRSPTASLLAYSQSRETLTALFEPSSEEVSGTARFISRWSSPTASLMKSPGEDWLNAIPPLGTTAEGFESFTQI